MFLDKVVIRGRVFACFANSAKLANSVLGINKSIVTGICIDIFRYINIKKLQKR